MPLLTPPSTSHRAEKENTAKFAFSLTVSVDVPKMSSNSPSSAYSTASDSSPSSSSSRNVVWSPHSSYHSLATPPKPRPTAASTNAWLKDRPVKSILKRRRISGPFSDATNSTHSSPLGSKGKSTSSDPSLLSLPEDLDTFFRLREATPEPSDPLCDLGYLEYPVSLILNPDAKLRELVEGYSILAARLRGTVQASTDADASWPLFQPLRKNRDAFVDCVVRDLGRALVDPVTTLECPRSEDEAGSSGDWEDDTKEAEADPQKVALPSPKSSPKKLTKKGMSAEQVKYARDLCTTCHAVIKLLCIVLYFPAVHNVFEEKHLKSILTAVLAIPMADTLPTPNSRKTYALAILLLQCQRLPQEILLPGRDRIAHALKRGIDGELGKEGKKGSANDGLKAIHDLCIFQPSTFVPAFAKPTVLPSILQNLLAPTLALRVQACHALGGLAYSLASQPPSNLHATASDIVVEFLLTVSPATPTKGGKSPSKATVMPVSSPIIRTLRTTMNAQDPTHVAQSPVWALSVIASLIVLLGSRMYTEKRVCQAIVNVFKLGAKHRKGAMRSLFSVAWRAMGWAWFQPDYDMLLEDSDGEEEQDPEEAATMEERKRKRAESKKRTREGYFQLLNEIVETQVALSMVAALLSSPSPTPEDEGDSLKRALVVMQSMANSPDPDTINDAALVLVNLLSASSPPSSSSSRTRRDVDVDYTTPSALLAENAHALLPQGLFTAPLSGAAGGLLAVDLGAGTGNSSLVNVVRGLFDGLPDATAIRALTRDEISREYVWEGIVATWRTILSTLEMVDDAEMPKELTRVWESLLISNVGILQDEGQDTAAFALRVVNVLIDILNDRKLNFTVKSSLSSATAAALTSTPSKENEKEKEPSGTTAFTNAELKLKVVKNLWGTVKTVFPRDQLSAAADALVKCLAQNVEQLTAPRKLVQRKMRSSSSHHYHITSPICAWTALCMNAMVYSGNGESDTADVMKVFWGLDAVRGQGAYAGAADGNDETSATTQQHWTSNWDAETRCAVWRTCVSAWKRNEGHWLGAAVLLAVPFINNDARNGGWTFSSDETTRWKELYECASSKALDDGLDSASTAVIDDVAGHILAYATLPPASSGASANLIQASDLLLDHLDVADMREVPERLVEIVCETMRGCYPPEPRNLSPATWFVQSLTRVVENCPKEMVKELVEGVSEAAAVWLKDECEVWTEDVLDYTFLPLYQHLLLRIQTLPRDMNFLEAISPLLDSVFSGRSMPHTVMNGFQDAFDQFWKMSAYSSMKEPKRGWPTAIRHCLGLDPDLETEVGSATTTPSKSSVASVPATPIRSKAQAKAGVAPRTPMVPMNGLHIPSPHRPHKPHADSLVPFPVAPRSPMSPVRRRRTSSGASSAARFPTTPLAGAFGMRLPSGESPSKRRKNEEDEENNPSPSLSTTTTGRRRLRALSMSVFDTTDITPVTDRIVASMKGKKKKAAPEADSNSVYSSSVPKRLSLREKMGTKPAPRSSWSPQRVRALAEKAASSRELPRARGRQERESRSPSPVASVGSSNDSEDERLVESSLVVFPTMEVDAEEVAGTTPEKNHPHHHQETEKEKEEVFAAIQTPKKRKHISALIPASEQLARASRRRKLEHAASFDSSMATTVQIPEAWKTPVMSMKRTLSGMDLMREARKRKRSLSFVLDSSEEEEDGKSDPFEVEVRTANPLPALHIPSYGDASCLPPPPPSFSLPEKDAGSDALSSDDDPHLGQVTPHHLISPALVPRPGKVYLSKAKRIPTPLPSLLSSSSKETEILDEVPGSDDSVGSAPDSSPSRSVAERQKRKRLGW